MIISHIFRTMDKRAVYKKLNTNQHVRLRSGMYLGSIQPQDYETVIIEEKSIDNKLLNYSYALYKAIDEVVVNAIDHVTRTTKCKGNDKCTMIDINFDYNTGEISVCNNGYGIEINKYEDEDIYIPEVIFSHVMSGSNFDDDDEDKANTGGMNGYGIKLTNITSKYFIVDTNYKGTNYLQKFEDGNNKVNPPKIVKNNVNDYTKITFMPEYEFFYGKAYNEEIGVVLYDLINTRSIFASIFCKTIQVKFNNELIKYNSISDLMDLIGLDYIKTTITNNKIPLDVCISVGDSNIKCLSLINGIIVKGGVHIKFIEKEIINNLMDKINKTVKNTKITNKMIMNHVLIMVSGYVNKPDFSSQTKDILTIDIKYFKDYTIAKSTINKIWTMLKPVLENIYLSSEKKKLSKTDGKKKNTVLMDNLDDATWAGTKKSDQCRLILTEGLSASTYAISGLKKLGRERYGVFPLKGKMLNVREASTDKINKNKEITQLKTILGLKSNYTYEDLSELRYGGIIILTDADSDGSHIKGLIINMIHAFWPELLEMGFITSIMTPIIRAMKGSNEINFYSSNEYEEWKDNTTNNKTYTIKYYKGLGTSEKKDAIAVFSTLDKHLINYTCDDDTDYYINLAFHKKKADDRKDWLAEYDYSEYNKSSNTRISYSDMINKELIHFSYYDNERNIPNICDGLKPSQRKILFTALKTMKTNNIKGYKVSQFGNKVAELTDYHHGEDSLSKAIINMAQNYISSNNCNLLLPLGGFGCLSPDTNIILFNGFSKKAVDINIDDVLIGDDAKPRKVLKLVNGVNHMFRLLLHNSSSNYEYFDCTIDHILTLHIPNNNKLININGLTYNKYFDGSKWNLSKDLSKKMDMDIFDVPLYEFIQWDNETKQKFRLIKNNQIIEVYKNMSIKEREDIIKVYFVERYLNRSKNKLTIKSIYEDKLEYLNEIALSLGYRTIMADRELIIYLLNRKYNDYVFTITYLGLQKFNGWEVDGNNRFLVESFIVTHNSRIHNGADAASPRYIFTNLTNTTPLLFNKYDNKILDYINSDGMIIEPKYYVPVLPIILINGSTGIGTGFSTKIPQFDLEDIARVIINKLNGKTDDYTLIPSYRFYNGTILEHDKNKFLCIGTYEIKNDNTITITEIPIGTSINKYKSILNDMIEKKLVKSYINNSNDSIPSFEITVEDSIISVLKSKNQANILTTFSLTSSISTKNMMLFNRYNKMTKYDSPNEILDEFYIIRLEYYEKRKKFIIKTIEDELIILQNKIRFIMMIVQKELKVIKVKIMTLNNNLEELNFHKHENKYDYLTSLPIHSLTIEKINELTNKCKDISSQLEAIKAKSIKKIWMEDITDIIKAYREYNNIIMKDLDK